MCSQSTETTSQPTTIQQSTTWFEDGSLTNNTAGSDYRPTLNGTRDSNNESLITTSVNNGTVNDTLHVNNETSADKDNGTNGAVTAAIDFSSESKTSTADTADFTNITKLDGGSGVTTTGNIVPDGGSMDKVDG